MKTSLLNLFFLSISFLGFSTPALAADVEPAKLVGKYGFDWLKPEKAKCLAVTAQTLAGAKSCKHRQEGDTASFTGKADFYVCKTGPKSEYMIYNSQARCAEELETMQANAP